MGITRLNVYAGEAAGYVITDAVDQDIINGTNISGVNIPTVANPNPNTPGNYLKVLPGIGIPLVIQDRTFVDAETIFAQDPTWNGGTAPRDPLTGNITGAVTGDLWYPHAYMTVQNPWDLTGTNAFGRWHYGPWFNPPVPTCVNGLPVGCIEVGPVANEYYQPVDYVERSFSIYRRTGQRVREFLTEIQNAGYDRVRILGKGDVVDICRLTCLEQGVEVVADKDAPALQVDGFKVTLQMEGKK